MTVLRKFGILTATGVVGYFGYRSFFNSQDEVLLSESNRAEMQKALTNSRHTLLDLQVKFNVIINFSKRFVFLIIYYIMFLFDLSEKIIHTWINSCSVSEWQYYLEGG